MECDEKGRSGAVAGVAREAVHRPVCNARERWGPTILPCICDRDYLQAAHEQVVRIARGGAGIIGKRALPPLEIRC